MPEEKKPLLDLSDPKFLAEVERIRRELQIRDQPFLKALRDSERISAEDLRIVINTR